MSWTETFLVAVMMAGCWTLLMIGGIWLLCYLNNRDEQRRNEREAAKVQDRERALRRIGL